MVFYPAEYNSYALGGAPITWRTDSAGNWRKEYKLFDHLGSVRTVLRKDESSTGYEYREQLSYKPFGEVKDRLYCTGSTDADARLKYIGKQMDFVLRQAQQPSLAVHGVRKYDNTLGIFTSIDPLWEKYYGWTPYHYCGNNPMMAVDPSGLGSLFLAFSGANKSGEHDAATAGKIVKDVDNYAQKNGITDYQSIAIPTDLPFAWDAKSTASDFILSNYKQGDEIIIYGYSLGGETAMILTRMLMGAGLKVSLLITVDATSGELIDQINSNGIEENVEKCINFYQETPGDYGSKGAPAYPNVPQSTQVVNNKVDGVNHYNIDEKTQKKVVNEVTNAIKPK